MPGRKGLAPSHVAAFAVAGVYALNYKLLLGEQQIDKRLLKVEDRIRILEAEIAELKRSS
jgi:hypothetical protein